MLFTMKLDNPNHLISTGPSSHPKPKTTVSRVVILWRGRIRKCDIFAGDGIAYGEMMKGEFTVVLR